MTPAAAKAMYRRQMQAHGETVTLERGATTATALARIMSPSPDELIDTIDQAQQIAVVLADDLVAGGFPVPPRKDDRLLRAGGEELFVEFVDAATRAVAGEVVAYELRVVG